MADVNLFTAGNFPYETSTLVGSTRVRNTGNVWIKVKVEFTWLMLGAPNITAKPKIVILQPGRTRLVNFVHPGITGEQVDAFQAHPNYMGNGEPGRTKVTIIDSGTEV